MNETAATPTSTLSRVEPLLSARLFLAPQVADDRLYFISNLSGRFSLYVMDVAGSVPEPLLPPDIALQNPELFEGADAFHVYPELDMIVLSVDRDGNEVYQPMRIPLDGGIPVPAFGDAFVGYRCFFGHQPGTHRLLILAEAEDRPIQELWIADLDTGSREKLGEGPWGPSPAGINDDASKLILSESYSFGDTVIWLLDRATGARTLLYGTPLAERDPDAPMSPTGIGTCEFVQDDSAILCRTAVFEDTYGLALLAFDTPGEMRPVPVTGTRHEGSGELTGLSHLRGDRFRVDYNIDGVSWSYEGTFDPEAPAMRLDTVLVGTAPLADGTLEHMEYDAGADRYALSFSTATSPTQLYTLEGPERTPVQRTRERLLGTPSALLSPGEDASFVSFDGLRISARLYLPAQATGFAPPYPLVYYVHGGPQSQERPNFAWFSMPLIQYLTMNGFAVFVPNVRGSEGYGIDYMKRVDRDWGGQDRLDHVHAMGLLAQDSRIDTSHAGVIGRSYGGYMTLTLAARHPDL